MYWLNQKHDGRQHDKCHRFSTQKNSRPLIMLLVYAALILAGIQSASATSSTFSTTSSGSRVFYQLLNDLGYRIRRTFEDIAEIDSRADLLILLGPSDRYPTERLLSWVRQGGKLLLALPLENREEYCGSVGIGSLQITRYRAPFPKPIQHPDLKLNSSRCLMVAPAQATVLAGTHHAALVADQSWGKGRLLILAHQEVLDNEHLHRDDLAVLIRHWMSDYLQPHATILIIEEHEGGALLSMLRRTHLSVFALHGIVWLLFLYWKLFPRFGDASSTITNKSRRAFAEHARALGGLYQRRGASALVLQHQYQHAIHQLLGKAKQRQTKVYSLPSSTDSTIDSTRPQKNWSALLATRLGLNTSHTTLLLKQFEEATKDPLFSDSTEVQRHFRLSQRLAALRRKGIRLS